MPELPEVETVRRALERTLIGRVVRTCEAKAVRLRAGLDPACLTARLPGACIERVVRRGKFLIIRFDRADLVIHLGMSGRLAVAPAEAPRAPHTHLVLGLDDRSELRFTDPRRFGSVVVRDAGAGNTYPPVAGLGPDPLQSDVAAVLVAAARRSRIAIRNLLLDQLAEGGIIHRTIGLKRSNQCGGHATEFSTHIFAPPWLRANDDHQGFRYTLRRRDRSSTFFLHGEQ